MKHQKKLNKKKVFLTLCIGVMLLYSLRFIYQNVSEIISLTDIFSQDDQSVYSIIKEDQNDNYAGKGQEQVKEQDGYFTTFTTENQKVYKEYKQNDGSWKDYRYWQDNMTESGCGITAMAIILSGYGMVETPNDLRNKYYPVLTGENMAKEFLKYGIDNTDFYFDETHLSKENLNAHLMTNRPVLICVWNKPHENRWTTTSHYMVLLASDGDDKVYISNPNGGKNDAKSSGWYQYQDIQPYIAKAMYIESY